MVRLKKKNFNISRNFVSCRIMMHLESRRGQRASISSIKITEGLPNFAWDDASAKASRKILSLSPACALCTEWGLQDMPTNQNKQQVQINQNNKGQK